MTSGAPQRVLVVLHDEVFGGATRAVLRPLEVLRARGLEVHVWCSDPSEVADAMRARSYPVAGVPRLMRYRLSTLRHPPGVRQRISSLPRMLRAFARELRVVRPDVVHANSGLSLPEALVARAMGFPVVFHSHEITPPGTRGRLQRLATWAGAHEVVTVSRAAAEALTWRGRAPAVVHESAELPDILASRIRPSGSAPAVAHVGMIDPRKGTDIFLEAVAELRRSGVDAEFTLAGAIEDGPVRPWAEAQLARARELGVSYHEHVDVADALPGWDVMVMPSRRDPFPLVVLEAMANAVPVVGADRDGIPEQLGDVAGVLVPPEDPRALAAAIAALLADPERRAELGAAGHARVASALTPAHAADALLRSYERAISRARS